MAMKYVVKYGMIFLGLLILSFMTSCSMEPISTKDSFSSSDLLHEIDGIRLSEGDVKFTPAKEIIELQFYPEYVVTNTTHITVSTEKIIKGTEVAIYLYDEDANTVIGCVTLENSKTNAVFSNLTSSERYKIGVIVNNSPDTITLTISEN